MSYKNVFGRIRAHYSVLAQKAREGLRQGLQDKGMPEVEVE